MPVKRVSRNVLLCTSAALAIAVALGASAPAQSANYGPAPATFPSIDGNGVDLSTGNIVLSVLNASVGQPGDGGLSRLFLGPGARDNLSAVIQETAAGTPQLPDQELWTVSLGATSATFVQQNTTAPLKPAVNATGRSLTLSTSNNTLTFTDRDGTVAVFDSTTGLVTQLTRPNGEVLTYRYSTLTGSCGANCLPQSVTSSLGYMIHYDYVPSSITAGFSELSKVTALNRASAACDEGAASCTLDPGWSSTSFTFTGTTEGDGTLRSTDSNGNTTTYQLANGQITQITTPTGNTRVITYSGGKVHTVTVGGRVWTYTFTNPINGLLQVVAQDPVGQTRTITTNTVNGQIDSVIDGMSSGNKTIFGSDQNGQITFVQNPENDVTSYTYDARGNIINVTHGSKSGATKPFATLTYDTTCTNPKTCNQPNAVTDVTGAETDFLYDPNSGLVSSETRPAGANGVRPRTIFTYAALTPSYLNGAGQTINGAPVWKLTDISKCMAQASCAGAADEVHTNLAYGSATPNNLQIISRTDHDGQSTISAQIQYTYNRFGDLKTVDGPLPGTVDLVRLRYDSMRQLVGKIFEDPDGQSVGRPAPAENISYTPDGLLSFVQFGTVPSQSDADWANSFTKLYTILYVRDAFTRVIQEGLRDGAGTTQALTQNSYYDNDQLKCSASRMNPGAFGSLPSDACTLGTQGSYGPDRISQYFYDANGRLDHRIDGLGTGQQTTPEKFQYTRNGSLQSIVDGNGNLTTLAYDDFDRQYQTFFPSPSTPGQSSTTDFVQNGYDPATWNLTSIRLRDGQNVTMGYDPRRNLISESLTNGAYTYDNFDRPVTASANGQTLTETYDVLGRKTAETGPMGTVRSDYDAGGRRSRLTLPSGFFTTYDYDNAGALVDVKDNAGQVLASFGFDNADRLVSVSRSNGVSTSYAYDSLSRPSSITHNFSTAGSANNVVISLGYGPTGKIVSRTLSNGAYQWTGAKNSATYAFNGLNQIANSNGLTFSYDGHGNLTSDGTKAYAYDAANRLTSAGALGLSWDPADRLSQTTVGTATTKFVYDGLDIVAEYDASGAEQKRYVHGSGIDQHLLVYENGTTSWPLADERGSTIAVANNSGGTLAINTFDEYGVPAASNYGRFQYTGQAWLPEAGLYHYKTRAYSPALGRFMQPDSVGYLGGANLYAYVGDDPINSTDTLGTDDPTTTVSEVVVTPDSNSAGSLAGGSGSAGFGAHRPAPDNFANTVSELVVTAAKQASKSLPEKVRLPNENIFTCAARVSNKLSIAGMFNIDEKQHPIGKMVLDAFAGNTFGGAVTFVEDISNLNGGKVLGGVVLSGPAQGLVSPTATTFLGVGGRAAGFANKGVAGVVTDVALNGIYGASKVGAVAGLAAEGLSGPIAAIKIGIDAGIFAYALLACR